MLITTKLNIDMQRNVQRHVVNVVQNDTNTRAVEFRLFSDCGRWIVPDGVTAALSYSKPDGTSGIYDKLPDGANAFTITGEAVTVILAPQMLTVPGEVRTALVLTESNSDQLSTFPFVVNVAESPNPGKIVSENYCYYTNLDAINAAINELKQAVAGNGGGTGGGSGSDSGQNLTDEQTKAIDGLLNVCAFIKPDVSAELAAFWAAFGIDGGGIPDTPDEPEVPEVTLSSISAEYSGGDVAVGTAVADLTGIVVTAHYSDGSQQNVTGYTLSGEIVEGENTVTVIYQGMTATFTVTGVIEPTKDWTSGTAYDLTGKIIVDTEISTSGAESTKEGWNSTDYLNCYGADYIHTAVRSYISFYDVNKNFISRVDCNLTTTLPNGAVYIRVSTFNAQYWLVTEESVVTPITKVTNFTAGEQTVTWVSGVLNVTTGEIDTASGSKTTEEMIPTGGATTLTLGDSAQISKIAYYDADKNYITYEQSKATPYTLLEAYSFARISAYNDLVGTITLA